MRSIQLIALILICLSSFGQSKKILIVATNRDSVGNNVSGTYLKEIAYPFQYFIDHGYEVNIVTPKGGKTAIYDNGNVPEDLSEIQHSKRFIEMTSNSLSPDQIKSTDYVAVFYPGGHGQYFDVVNDERIARITASIHSSKGVIGTAGHGVASLINVQLKNGQYLVDGKRMTCFPTWAEKVYMNISNYGKLLPFDMEEILRRRGTDLIVSTKETNSNKELTNVVDVKNKIVTGAFAWSAPWVAEEMVKLIETGK